MYHINSTKFLLRWLGGSLAVWVVAGFYGVIGGLAGLVLSLVAVALLGTLPYADLMVGEWVTVALIGMGVGYAVGIVQQWLVRKYLLWDLEQWPRFSAVGGLLGALVVMAFIQILLIYDSVMLAPPPYVAPPIVEQLFSLAPMTLFIALVSIAQWLVLRHYVRAAWLWIGANVVGGMIFASLLLDVQPFLIAWLLATLGQGAVTGATMLWLFTKLIREDILPEPAPVTVPVEARPQERNQRSSIWDEAI